MKKTLKSAILLVIVSMLLFVLTGCANVNYEIKLSKDGSGEVSYIMGYDKSFLNSMGATKEDLEGDDTLDEMQDEARQEGYTIEKFEDNNTYGFKASKHVNNIQEEFDFDDIVEEDSIKDNRIIFEESFLKTKYSQNAILDLSMDEEDEEDALTNMMMSQIDVSYKITLPFKAGENNATTVSEDGKTLEWVLKAGQVNEIKFEATQDYMIYLIGGIIGLAVIIVIITLIVILTKKNKSKKQDDVPVKEEQVKETKNEEEK